MGFRVQGSGFRVLGRLLNVALSRLANRVLDAKREALGVWVLPQNLHSSSFLRLPYRILNINHKKELLWSLGVRLGFSELGAFRGHVSGFIRQACESGVFDALRLRSQGFWKRST